MTAALLWLFLVAGQALPVGVTCTTDSECADRFSGNGDPEPVEDPHRFDGDTCAETDAGCPVKSCLHDAGCPS